MKELIRAEFGKELIRLAASNDFVIFNADTKSCSIENFGSLYPERNYTFGIAEQNLFSAAAGAALSGEKVYLATFAVFASMRACEQLRTFICNPKLNVTVLASHGGLLTGADGATHIAVEDLSITRAIPNLTVIEPSDSVAGRQLVAETLTFQGPLYIRFPKAATDIIHGGDYKMKIGKGNVIRSGSDVSIFATGWILSRALESAEVLAAKGISAEVIEIHTLKPLDAECVLSSIAKTRAAVTVEDNTILGGLGSAVCELAAEYDPVPIKRIGIRDRFGESGDPELLYRDNAMTTQDIEKAALSVIERKRGAKS